MHSSKWKLSFQDAKVIELRLTSLCALDARDMAQMTEECRAMSRAKFSSESSARRVPLRSFDGLAVLGRGFPIMGFNFKPEHRAKICLKPRPQSVLLMWQRLSRQR